MGASEEQLIDEAMASRPQPNQGLAKKASRFADQIACRPVSSANEPLPQRRGELKGLSEQQLTNDQQGAPHGGNGGRSSVGRWFF